jgi:hypothetical protein
MKRSGIVVLLLFLSIGNFAQSSWRGEASVWSDGLPASGFFAATDEFPPQTVLLVKNLRTGKSLQVRVLSRGPEENNGEFIFLNAMAGSYLGIQENDNDPVVVTWESDIAKSEENFLEEDPGDTVTLDEDPTPPANNQTIPVSLEEKPETILVDNTEPTDPDPRDSDPDFDPSTSPQLSPEIAEGDDLDPENPLVPDTPQVAIRPTDVPVDPIENPLDPPAEDPESPRVSPGTLREGPLASVETQLPNFPTRPDADPVDPPADETDSPRVSPRMATSESRLLPNLVLPGEPAARVPAMGQRSRNQEQAPAPLAGMKNPRFSGIC